MFVCFSCPARALWRTWHKGQEVHPSLACNQHTREAMVSLPRFGRGAWMVLNALVSVGPLSTLELIEEVWPGRAFGAAAGTLDRLADSGFITRTPDGKRRIIDITALGRRAQENYHR